jgi:cellulose synthase/poly-beta-1,6-N-acetylglucosamine synthase-like glycosyltransferase
MEDFMKCSLGIFAYNEEKNIGRLLKAILNQELNQVEIEEILIIGDGCTDKTIPIAKRFAEKDKRIKIFAPQKRLGKAGAVNLFLRKAKNNILVMESGDTLPKKNTMENLVRPFFDQKVGMTGARPVPVDNPKTFLGFVSHLLWELHHQISLKNPKMGEMVAFRKVFEKIPQTAVDEAYIEGLLKSKGYKVIYAPEAVVYNKGPETVSDFLRQRRRIYWGHLLLKESTGYQVSTTNLLKTFRLLFRIIPTLDSTRPGLVDRGRRGVYLIGAIFLEALGRFLGWWDYKVKKRSHVIWEMAESTKEISKIKYQISKRYE